MSGVQFLWDEVSDCDLDVASVSQKVLVLDVQWLVSLLQQLDNASMQDQ